MRGAPTLERADRSGDVVEGPVLHDLARVREAHTFEVDDDLVRVALEQPRAVDDEAPLRDHPGVSRAEHEGGGRRGGRRQRARCSECRELLGRHWGQGGQGSRLAFAGHSDDAPVKEACSKGRGRGRSRQPQGALPAKLHRSPHRSE